MFLGLFKAESVEEKFKMIEEYLILFNFQSSSFRTEKVLNDLGVQVDFIPTPRKYGELCATSLRVSGLNKEKLEEVLKENGVTYAGVHPYTPSKLLKDFGQKVEEESFSGELKSIMERIREDTSLKKEDIRYLFNLTNQKELQGFFQLAEQVRTKVLGKSVDIWALVRLDGNLEQNSLFAVAKELEARGINFLMLELGGLTGISKEELLAIIKEIQTCTSLKLIVTGNQNIFNYYGILQKAGIPYLIKHITLEDREVFLAKPQEILEEIFFLWHEGKSQLFGFTPLLPMPYPVENGFNILGEKITALLRVLFKDALLPAFNCATTLDLEEQMANLRAGANLLLLDFTPEVRELVKDLRKIDNVVELLTKNGYQANGY